MSDCEHCFCESGAGYCDNWIRCCKCGETMPLFDIDAEGAKVLDELVQKLKKGHLTTGGKENKS